MTVIACDCNFLGHESDQSVFIKSVIQAPSTKKYHNCKWILSLFANPKSSLLFCYVMNDISYQRFRQVASVKHKHGNLYQWMHACVCVKAKNKMKQTCF